MAIGTTAALLVGGGLLGSAALSSSASKSAGEAVAGATDRAAELQNQQFQQLLQLQMPGYNRAEGAAGIYGAALGLNTMQGQSTGQPQTLPAQGTQNGQQNGQFTGQQIGRGLPVNQGRALTDDYAIQPGQRGMMTGSYTGGQTSPVQGGQPQTQSQAAAGQPLDIAGQVMNTPGYQTQMDQGLKAIDRAAPLVGGMYSGRRMKALNDYGQQTFGSYYNDWMNRVGGIAGQAPQIANNIGQAGQQNANNVGNLMMTGANARAQGQLNSASAWTGAIGNMAGMAGGFYG